MPSIRPAADVAFTCGVLALGIWVVPPALRAGTVLAHRDDPSVIADYRLSKVSPGDLAKAIDDSLTGQDPERAASLLMLADSLNIPLPAELRDRVTAAQGTDLGQIAGDIWDGAVSGNADSPASLSGALAADITGVGDVRDLVHEGGAYLDGADYDRVTLALAAVGLTITVATVASLGAAAPVRVGATVLKVANKSKRLSPPLRGELVRLAGDAVDGEALRAAMDVARTGDLAAARTAMGAVLRPAPLRTLRSAAEDLGSVVKAQGYRASADVLKVSASTADVRKLAALSERFGPRFRGVLAVLGTTALTLTGLSLTLASWIASATLWALTAMYFSWRLLRRLWR